MSPRSTYQAHLRCPPGFYRSTSPVPKPGVVLNIACFPIEDYIPSSTSPPINPAPASPWWQSIMPRVDVPRTFVDSETDQSSTTVHANSGFHFMQLHGSTGAYVTFIVLAVFSTLALLCCCWASFRLRKYCVALSTYRRTRHDAKDRHTEMLGLALDRLATNPAVQPTVHWPEDVAFPPPPALPAPPPPSSKTTRPVSMIVTSPPSLYPDVQRAATLPRPPAANPSTAPVAPPAPVSAAHHYEQPNF